MRRLQRLRLAFLLNSFLLPTFAAPLVFADPPPPAAAPVPDAVRGKSVFLTNCMTCHGAKGDGKGPAAAALDPKPANFTDPAVQARVSDKEMDTAIRKGGAAVGKSAAMPAWGGTLKENDIRSVQLFIRSLAK